MTLTELMNDHTGRLFYKPIHYFHIYEEHFKRFRYRPTTILEIGVQRGGSLQLWKKYFQCPGSRVIGIDIDPSTEFAEEGISVCLGSQSDTEFLSMVTRGFGNIDIVIDDGSHRGEDTRTSFEFLYPHISPVGIYAVEDVGTSYWPEYGDVSFVRHAQDLVDSLEAYDSRGAITPTRFTDITRSIHFYESLIVFEKQPYKPNPTISRGTA